MLMSFLINLILKVINVSVIIYKIAIQTQIVCIIDLLNKIYFFVLLKELNFLL